MKPFLTKDDIELYDPENSAQYKGVYIEKGSPRELKQQILSDQEKAKKYDELKEKYDELVLEYKDEVTRGE